ncbi:hypothetical protein LDENG_00155400 [Lucifuga dentata]|nr:hypothetical protein LDENG_00155400 [Lucifuga dentata]
MRIHVQDSHSHSRYPQISADILNVNLHSRCLPFDHQLLPCWGNNICIGLCIFTMDNEV